MHHITTARSLLEVQAHPRRQAWASMRSPRPGLEQGLVMRATGVPGGRMSGDVRPPTCFVSLRHLWNPDPFTGSFEPASAGHESGMSSIDMSSIHSSEPNLRSNRTQCGRTTPGWRCSDLPCVQDPPRVGSRPAHTNPLRRRTQRRPRIGARHAHGRLRRGARDMPVYRRVTARASARVICSDAGASPVVGIGIVCAPDWHGPRLQRSRHRGRCARHLAWSRLPVAVGTGGIRVVPPEAGMEADARCSPQRSRPGGVDKHAGREGAAQGALRHGFDPAAIRRAIAGDDGPLRARGQAHRPPS